MVYPRDRFKTPKRRKEKKKSTFFIIAGVGLFGVVVLAATYLGLSRRYTFLDFRLTRDRTEVYQLWEDKRYSEVIDITSSIIDREAMEPTALVLGGFAYFYEGNNRVAQDERRTYVSRSVAHLRKALLLDETPLPGPVHYVLAKAYFDLGPVYSDLVVENMRQAVDHGYVATDTYEYLAMASSHLGRTEDTARYLRAAIDRNPSDKLYFTLAEVLRDSGDSENAERYFTLAIATTDDTHLADRSTIRIAEILISTGRFDEAADLLFGFMEQRPESADAHYWLGVLYHETDTPERARLEWREAVRLDPGHREALRRLQD